MSLCKEYVDSYKVLKLLGRKDKKNKAAKLSLKKVKLIIKGLAI